MLSTISALLVRILISSGVVLLFPLFWIVQRFTSHGISWRIISLSYPWIGIPIEVLRSRNQSIEPFIIAHICRIIVYYVLYEAAQLAFSVWFYNDSRPGQKELWIFAIMMLLEYYNMIYLRSRGSIVLFPRVILSTYMIYHIYIYVHPNGFHLLALLVMFMFMAWNMIFCVRKFELPAYSCGHVSIDAPRVLHNRVPWPMWSIAIAPDFTLFWPLDHQSMTIYGTAADNTSQANPVSDNSNSSTNPPNRSDNGGDVELGSSSNITSSSNNTNGQILTDGGKSIMEAIATNKLAISPNANTATSLNPDSITSAINPSILSGLSFSNWKPGIFEISINNRVTDGLGLGDVVFPELQISSTDQLHDR
eukprot:gene18789-24556_t